MCHNLTELENLYKITFIQIDKDESVECTLLGDLSGEMAIFLPVMLCSVVVLWGSERVIVLEGIPRELCVKTRPLMKKHKIWENMASLPHNLKVYHW